MKGILKTVQKALTNNWMLKILAFVIAAIVWLAVINVNDPTKTVTIYNIPITMVNEEAITQNNQIYSVDGNTRVNVTVSGRRSVVEALNSNSFIAEASLNELSVTNSVPVTITLKNMDLASKLTISKQSITQLALNIENVETKTYAVEESIIGAVSKNYEIDDVELARNKIDVTAPESVHNQIDKVVVNVDIDGLSADYTDKFKVTLLDKSGNRIVQNNNIILSRNKIQVSISVLKLIKVPLVVETTGTLNDGYELIGVTTDPEEITLAGPPSIVNTITELTISGEVADISMLTDSVERKINLIDYLISGVYIRGTAEATLAIDIEGDVTKEFTYKPSDIDIKNLSAGSNAEITSTEIKITLSGKKRDFEGVTADSLKAAISLKDLKKGKRNVELLLEIPKGLKIVSSDKVKVNITEKND